MNGEIGREIFVYFLFREKQESQNAGGGVL